MTQHADGRGGSGTASRIRVWDLPTRIFHWTLAACVVGSFATAKIGGNLMVLHGRLGYLALALLLFRLAWGFVGGRYARFCQFLAGPARIVGYLRGATTVAAGHNPLGALSVLALLAAVGFQAVTGLFAWDEVAFDGPLAKRVSEETSLWLTGLHGLNEKVILALVVLHLAAIAYYRLRRSARLVAAMVTGDAEAPAGTPASRDDAGLRLRALAVLAASAAIVAAIVTLGG